MGLSGATAVARGSDDTYLAYCLDEAITYFGTWVESELDQINNLKPDEKAKIVELQNRKQRKLEEVLKVGARQSSSRGLVLVNKVDVPGRTRPPQADDPEDPFGLWDKSDPGKPHRKYAKDPADLWKERERA